MKDNKDSFTGSTAPNTTSQLIDQTVNQIIADLNTTELQQKYIEGVAELDRQHTAGQLNAEEKAMLSLGKRVAQKLKPTLSQDGKATQQPTSKPQPS